MADVLHAHVSFLLAPWMGFLGKWTGYELVAVLLLLFFLVNLADLGKQFIYRWDRSVLSMASIQGQKTDITGLALLHFLFV